MDHHSDLGICFSFPQPPIHQLAPPREPLGQLGTVRHDDKHCPFLAAQLQQERSYRLGGVPVEVAGRFIGQEQGRAVDEGPADGDALPLASRKFRRPVPNSRGQPDTVEQEPGTFFGGLVGAAPGQCGNQDVFEDRALRQEIMVLKDETDVRVSEPGQTAERSSAKGSCPRMLTEPPLGVSSVPMI